MTGSAGGVLASHFHVNSGRSRLTEIGLARGGGQGVETPGRRGRGRVLLEQADHRSPLCGARWAVTGRGRARPPPAPAEPWPHPGRVPAASSRCMRTMTTRPSGWRSLAWLPRCETCVNPARSRALATSLRAGAGEGSTADVDIDGGDDRRLAHAQVPGLILVLEVQRQGLGQVGPGLPQGTSRPIRFGNASRGHRSSQQRPPSAIAVGMSARPSGKDTVCPEQ